MDRAATNAHTRLGVSGPEDLMGAKVCILISFSCCTDHPYCPREQLCLKCLIGGVSGQGKNTPGRSEKDCLAHSRHSLHIC